MPAPRHARDIFPGFFTVDQFDRIRSVYEASRQATLAVLDAEGTLLAGSVPGRRPGDYRDMYVLLINESLRWGEARFDLLPEGSMVWVVPLMMNARLLGGIAAHADIENAAGSPDSAIEAAAELTALLERENLTNSQLLAVHRRNNRSERHRAEAIHVFKSTATDFRAVYVREESALLTAIKKGDMDEARVILNRIMLSLPENTDAELTKSFLVLLVSAISRTALESGCDIYEVLDGNRRQLAALHALESRDSLASWLDASLDRLAGVILRGRNTSSLALLQVALAYMHDNFHRPITRDEVAAVAHLSPAHFTHLMKKEFNDTFTNILNRIRVNHASVLLARTTRSLNLIALDSGFRDQSYFSKIFHKHTSQTPRQYRYRLASLSLHASEKPGAP